MKGFHTLAVPLLSSALDQQRGRRPLSHPVIHRLHGLRPHTLLCSLTFPAPFGPTMAIRDPISTPMLTPFKPKSSLER